MATKKITTNYKKCSISFTLIITIDEESKKYIDIDYFGDNGIGYEKAMAQVKEDLLGKDIGYSYPAPGRQAKVIYGEMVVAIRKFYNIRG